MKPYKLLIAYDVIEFMESLKKSEVRALRNRFLQITDFPEHYSDYTEPDDIGRLLSINVCGRFAIKYWADFSTMHLKILDVHLADRTR
jgi:hypothetical protein